MGDYFVWKKIGIGFWVDFIRKEIGRGEGGMEDWEVGLDGERGYLGEINFKFGGGLR